MDTVCVSATQTETWTVLEGARMMYIRTHAFKRVTCTSVLMQSHFRVCTHTHTSPFLHRFDTCALNRVKLVVLYWSLVVKMVNAALIKSSLISVCGRVEKTGSRYLNWRM